MTNRPQIDSVSLLKAVENLKAQAEVNSDRVAIGVETDLDEAFLIGTPQALIRLAVALLQAAASGNRSREVAGVNCHWSEHTHDVMDHMAQVVVGAECIVQTDAERELLVQHFRGLAGD